jgi:predicted RNA-binding protein with PUA-like domain
MPPGRLHVGYYPPSNYTTQAIQGASYFSWPTDNTIEPNLPGTNGANFINGLEGIVTTNSTHVNQNPHGIRQWYDLSWSSGSQSGGVINNTYGTQTGKIYMHISFLAPGDDLHDGTLHCTNAELLNSNLISGGWDSSSQIYNNLQAIHGGGVFTWYESGNNPYNFKSILETGPNNTPGTSTWNSGTPGYDPGSNGDLLTKHDTQWDLVDPQDIAFANNLQAGNKFRFTNDANSTIYTILSSNYLNPLKVYNHTSWRTIYKTDGSSGSTATGDSVEEAVIKWAKSTDGTNYDGANGTDADVVALKQKLQDFGSANNRRLVYVVELDNDPSNSSSYNPVSGSTMDSSNFSGIEFVSEDFELNSGEISQKPAIWETEPKESVDLDIYYEASQAYPITLIEENRELFAPIGCS